jgi:hypothetical protein
MKTRSYLLLVCLSIFTFACKEDDNQPAGNGNLRIEFENVVGNQSLQLGDQTYTNASDEPYTISQFMYYVSNFTLTKKDGSNYQIPDSYFLVNQENTDSRVITLTGIPAGDYTGLSFVIGVDSARNMSGAQTGALDPINGMFWSWNTGYIFVRMEGNSPISTQPSNKLQFHIGGFKGATNCIRIAAPSLNGNTLRIRNGKTPEAHYQVNVASIFGAPNPVSFATLSAVHGGENAVKLADNYQTMFTLDHVHNND